MTLQNILALHVKPRRLALAAVLALTGGGAAGSDWIKLSTGSWFDPANWSAGVVSQGSFAIANLANGGNELIGSPDVAVDFLTLDYPNSVPTGKLDVDAFGVLGILDTLNAGSGTLSIHGGGRVKLPLYAGTCALCVSGAVQIGGTTARVLASDAASTLDASANVSDIVFSAAAVPEPMRSGLWLAGGLALFVLHRRRLAAGFPH